MRREVDTDNVFSLRAGRILDAVPEPVEAVDNQGINGRYWLAALAIGVAGWSLVAACVLAWPDLF